MPAPASRQVSPALEKAYQFLAWLDAKLEPHVGKLIPPVDVVEDELRRRVEAKIRDAVRDRGMKHHNDPPRAAPKKKRPDVSIESERLRALLIQVIGLLSNTNPTLRATCAAKLCRSPIRTTALTNSSATRWRRDMTIKRSTSKRDRRMAYHEAGHAVVARRLG